jgi:hypothetical protein
MPRGIHGRKFGERKIENFVKSSLTHNVLNRCQQQIFTALVISGSGVDPHPRVKY